MESFLAISKALSDETRVRALLSVKDGELCLCQIIELLGLAPATVSKHMTVLHQAGLVRRRKHGRWQFYRLAGEGDAPAARRALAWVLGELDGDATIRRDRGRLRQVRDRALEELSACYRS